MKVLLLCLYYLVVIHVVCLSFWGVFIRGWLGAFSAFICFMVTLYSLLVCFQSVSNSLYSALCCLNPSLSVLSRSRRILGDKFEDHVIVPATCGCRTVVGKPQSIIDLETKVDTSDIPHRTVLFQFHTGTSRQRE
jgi:hypothetical protein